MMLGAVRREKFAPKHELFDERTELFRLRQRRCDASRGFRSLFLRIEIFGVAFGKNQRDREVPDERALMARVAPKLLSNSSMSHCTIFIS